LVSCAAHLVALHLLLVHCQHVIRDTITLTYHANTLLCYFVYFSMHWVNNLPGMLQQVSGVYDVFMPRCYFFWLIPFVPSMTTRSFC